MTDATSLRIGIDIGGTFTDLTLFDVSDASLRHHKVPSTPSEPSRALVDGVAEMVRDKDATPGDLDYLVHGTTLALNTLLQRRGARVALIVAHANRHVLDLARLRLPEQFSFTPRLPQPLVAADSVIAIGGRILANGEERDPLDTEELAALPDRLQALEVDACAVALINAYANPVHERAIAQRIRQALPDLPVSISSEVWPEIREYERTMVTVMNAYVAPQMDRYFAHLRRQLTDLGVASTPLITRSNGGLMSVDEAARLPVETLISGPAAGVVGARFVAQQAMMRDCITFDMGGTSADVSVIQDGRATRSSEAQVGDFPVVIPAVDVTAVGAGGGSIAWIDPAGMLKVGPLSAGADPGPACYGRGGTEPTVTDAYLVCGFLDPDRFAQGQITLDTDAALTALEHVGAAIGMDARATATAIVRLATVTMAAQLSPMMASLGLDPRDFALLPYGGAGPVHANLLAEEIGLAHVLVPASPGTLCATGALINNLSRDWVRTFRAPVGPDVIASLRDTLHELEQAARDWIAAQPVSVEREEITFALDMRYIGQAYEIEVGLPGGPLPNADELAQLFHARHDAIHRHFDPEARVEIINLRVHAIGVTPDLPIQPLNDSAQGEPPQPIGTRPVALPSGDAVADVYDRDTLRAADRVTGPAIVEQPDTTTLVLPDYTATVDDFGNLHITRDA